VTREHVSVVSRGDREKDEKMEVKLLRSEGGWIHQENKKKVGGCTTNVRERRLISVELL
jgi:hypothetical protein